MTLGIDAGQTGTRALLSRGGASRSGSAPGVRPIDSSAAVTPEGVAAALLLAAESADLDGALPDAVGVGLSGFETAHPPELARIAAAMRERLGGGRIAIASDGLTSLLGALGAGPGVVVAAGTGTVVMGHDGNGRFAKVDAWGVFLSDAGSGYFVGRAGLDAALREHDGRGGSAALMRAAEQAFEGPLDELPLVVRRAPSASRAVASFARSVAECARGGDPIARRIWDDAGAELALSAHAALRRLFPEGEQVPVSYTGGLFNEGELLLEPLRRGLSERWPGAALVPPAGSSLDGALVLAESAGSFEPAPGILWREQ